MPSLGIYLSNKLVQNLVQLSGMSGPCSAEDMNLARSLPTLMFADGSFHITKDAVEFLIQDLGLWAVDFELELDPVRAKLHEDFSLPSLMT